MQRPDLIHVMLEHEHVARDVFQIADVDECLWLLCMVFEGEMLPMAMTERPAKVGSAALFHYSREEVGEAVRSFHTGHTKRTLH